MITKADLGLDKVNNYDIATLEEAIDPSVNNKYLTPAGLQYALDKEKELSNPPTIPPNSLSPIIPSTAPNSSATLTANFESLIDKGNLPKTTVVGTNALVSVEPSEVTNQNTFTFVATNTNTGPVTFQKNGITLPIVNYNKTPLSAGVIIKDKSYALMYSNSTYILVNPSDPFEVEYVDEAILTHKESEIAHPLVSFTAPGFMSPEDKTKLENVSDVIDGMDTNVFTDLNLLKTSKLDTSLLATSNGIATLDSSGKLSSSQIPNSLLGALIYQGTWNALNNIPVLTSGTGITGHYYKVATEGNIVVDGITGWKLGDSVVFNGSTWDKIDGGSSEVYSVNGVTGDVIINKSTLGLSNVDNTPDSNKPISVPQLNEMSRIESSSTSYTDIKFNEVKDRLDSINITDTNLVSIFTNTLG
jgi:hypothetical protein